MAPEDLLAHVRALAPEEGGPRPGEGLLVALSGGGDSVALLDLLDCLAPERELRLVAAHVDHALRSDSEEDRRFCADLCAERGITFDCTRVDVAGRAEATGMGIEAAGREARYAWLDARRKAHGLDLIATGHHLDDHVETLLLWMGRGTGLAGLRGIAPRRGRRLRPLRHLTRLQLRTHLRERGLAWREDPSNHARDRVRSRLRHEAIPALVEIFGPGFAGRFAGFAARAAGDLAGLERLGAAALRECLWRETGRGRAKVVVLDREAFRGLDEVLRRQVLWRVVARLRTLERAGEEPGGGGRGPQKWNEEHMQSVLSFTETAAAGKRRPLPGGGWLEVERNLLAFRGPEAATADPPEAADGAPNALEGPWRLEEELLPRAAAVVNFLQDNEALFDADSIRPPLRLRTVVPGDRIRPFGMHGHKKLVTLQGERSVPRHRRRSALVVEDADRIIWAVGLTTCEDTRIGERTERVLRLRLVPERSENSGSDREGETPAAAGRKNRLKRPE